MSRILSVGGFSPEGLAALRRDCECVDITAPEEALDYFRAHHEGLSAVIMSLRMPKVDGCTAMELMHRSEPELPVIISTKDLAVETVVNAMERGAFSYVYEPDLARQLPVLLQRAFRHMEAIRENRRLRSLLSGEAVALSFVGHSAAARAVVERLTRAANSSASVLLSGESGTGKEVAARLLHDQSPRRAAPFVPVNCGALSPALLESELFGYARGAFTGANKDHAGLFEEADGGTLFLDEIGVTDNAFQVRLLRVLEDGSFRRVGDAETRRVSVRIVAATNEPLEAAVRRGAFRADLYHRLNVVFIALPPLRERREDIALLAHHLLARLKERYPEAPQRLAPAALRVLESYSWPGNVRELRNALEHAVLMGGKDKIHPGDLPESLGTALPRLRPQSAGEGLDAALAAFERELVGTALREAEGNRAEAARRLKIKRTTLLAKLARLGIKTR